MNREVHVRFWESPEVKVLRATRQSLHFVRVPLLPVLPGQRTSPDRADWSVQCQTREWPASLDHLVGELLH
jgi:hypothetical protein